MKQMEVLYTYNVTMNSEMYQEYVPRMEEVLKKTEEILNSENIKAVFLIDVVMFFHIKNDFPNVYMRLKKVFNELSYKGHSLEILINSLWKDTDELHHLDQEKLLDLFAHAKFLIEDFAHKSKKDNLSAIRVLSSKIQPFTYLESVYQMLGLKVDLSLLSKIKSFQYFDFSAIQKGEIIKFTKGPNIPERFGRYLGISRTTFDLGWLLKMQIRSQIKNIRINHHAMVQPFIDEKSTLRKKIEHNVFNQSKEKILSPDIIPPHLFKRIIEAQRRSIKHLCVLESTLDNICPLTQENLLYINSNSSYKLVTLQDITARYSTTYNKIHIK